MTIFAIGGLGADERVFQYLTLDAPIHFIPWIEPLPNESIASYSMRMIKHLEINSNDIIIAVSFGGLIAQQISLTKKIKKVILISSIIDKREIPVSFRSALNLGIHTLLPIWILNKYNPLLTYLFTIKSNSAKDLLKSIIRDTNGIFVKWALGQIGKVKKNSNPDIIKIHGTNDRLIKYTPELNDYKIDGGGHFMIVEEADQVSRMLNTIIQFNCK